MLKYKKIRKYSNKVATQKIQKKQPLKQLILKGKQSGSKWVLTNKNGQNSSTPNVDPNGGRIDWTFPKLSQVIYPGQTVRIFTGWQSTNLADKTMLHTMPHTTLLQYNLIGLPQILTEDGSDLSQVLINNNDFPIQIAIKDDNSGVQLRKINPNTLQTQPLGFDFMHLISSLVGVAQTIVPFFL